MGLYLVDVEIKSMKFKMPGGAIDTADGINFRMTTTKRPTRESIINDVEDTLRKTLGSGCVFDISKDNLPIRVLKVRD